MPPNPTRRALQLRGRWAIQGFVTAERAAFKHRPPEQVRPEEFESVYQTKLQETAAALLRGGPSSREYIARMGNLKHAERFRTGRDALE